MSNEQLKSMLQKAFEEATLAVMNAISVAAPGALSSALRLHHPLDCLCDLHLQMPHGTFNVVSMYQCKIF